MRLESLVLAFSISSGCPSFNDMQPTTETEAEMAQGMDDLQRRQAPQLQEPNTSDSTDADNPNPHDEPELEPVEGLTVYQQFTTDNAAMDDTCELTFQTVGDEYNDKCDDCVFAFEVHTKSVGAPETNGCEVTDMDNEWLLRAYEVDTAGSAYGVENFRLQFRQTLETEDKTLTNVLVSVVDTFEYIGNGDEVEIVEETHILAHDDSETGRAGVDGDRVWWTLDDGVSRVMASGVFAR